MPLRHLVTLVQYGTSERAHTEPVGTPVLRMNNLQATGWDLSDLKYIQLEPEAKSQLLLKKGDLLFNRTNGSKKLVGKCDIFQEAGEWVFASYLIRVRLDERKVLPAFVSDFLNTRAGRTQINRSSRQMLMSNISAEELRDLVIPLPPLEIQQALIAEMEAARETRRRRLAEADALLEGLDGWLLEQLGITPLPADERSTFAVRRYALRGRRMDVPAYLPFYAQGHPPETSVAPLQELAAIDAHRATKPSDENQLVPYVGLPECEQTEVREVVMRPFHEVKGRSVVHPGDILFARIEPSIFNQKYVFVEDLKGHDYAYTSTEFYVITPRPNAIVAYYLYAMFFCSFVFNQAKGKTTGSSGRRRLDPEMFANLRIPKPELTAQRDIADEVSRRHAEARRLRAEAEAGWQAAKLRFEQQLLTGA